MDSNKRRTSSIDSYFSVQKKTKSRDDALNSVNVNHDSIVSTSSPTPSSLISIPVHDVALVNLNNINNSVQINPVVDDINRSHIDPPCQPILDKYPINEDNRSFQARCSSNLGNLLEILRWSSDVDPISKAVLEDSAQNATYLSHHIQNELIDIMANTVREQISNLIRGKYFALIADESRDVSGHEQLSIVIRIVNDPSDNNNDTLKEYFMGFVRLHQFDAESLSLEIVKFLQQHNIQLDLCIAQCYDGKRCRTRTIPARFANPIITSTVGHRDDDGNDEYRIRTSIYYPLIDAILIELNDRFSNSNLNLLTSLSSLYPESENFLEFHSLREFADHLNCDRNLLENELNVIKPMVKDDKLKSIAGLYKKLTPYKNAFPTAVCMVAGALPVPVSSTTCERSFSKMKLIKTYTRNTMSDTRLSDMCLLCIEKDFEIDFEKVIDIFSLNHVDSRILLR
ncbi:unnamed protein product [Rotaria sp. Silwood1]|nr:unnamed protein product [Rotaria sp. Silwood1]